MISALDSCRILNATLFKPNNACFPFISKQRNAISINCKIFVRLLIIVIYPFVKNVRNWQAEKILLSLLVIFYLTLLSVFSSFILYQSSDLFTVGMVNQEFNTSFRPNDISYAISVHFCVVITELYKYDIFWLNYDSQSHL